MNIQRIINETISHIMKESGSHVITVEHLPADHRAWYKSDVALRTDSGWFPIEALCDVVNRKYVPKPEVPSVFIGGNFGSASIGIGEKDLQAAIDLLKQAGHTVIMKN